MNSNSLFCLLATVLLTTASSVDAQQPKKVPRICYLAGSNAAASAIIVKSLRERLREIGYAEGAEPHY